MRPLRFKHMRRFFPNYSVYDLVRVYGVVGGTPACVIRLDNRLPLRENIKRILTPRSYLYDEAMNLLRQEVREPRTYFSILLAISEGRNSLSEIARAVHVDIRTIGKYVSLLEELDIVRRVRPLGYQRPVKLRLPITTLGSGSDTCTG